MKSYLVVYAMLVLIMNVQAQAYSSEARTLSDDPVVDARVHQISGELRCLVCQNETLADSTAPLAQDLKSEIHDMVVRGQGDREITDFLVARYGDFVRYRPPFKSTTLLLWLGPFILLIAGVLGLMSMLKARQKLGIETAVSAEQRRKIEQLLNKG